MKKLIIARKFSQILFLGLFVYIVWSTTYPLNSIISPKVLFKLDPLIMFFTAISVRQCIEGIVLSILVAIFALIFGRYFCGWICPVGTSVDIAAMVNKRNLILSDGLNNNVKKPKYYILFIVSFLAILGFQAAWILDPIVIFARFLSLSFIPGATFVIDKTFIFAIKNFELYGGFYDFYRSLNDNLLGIKIQFFVNSGISLSIFLAIVLIPIIIPRLWCRTLCPLGALFGIFSKISVFKRAVEKCTDCKNCYNICRMQAINKDLSYIKSECVLCMDCVYSCPTKGTSFKFDYKNKLVNTGKGKGTISRRDFLFLLLISLPSLGFSNKNDKKFSYKAIEVIRPPGVKNEELFLKTCVRCGNCMKVCITNGLQPTLLKSGVEGLWTPQLVPEIGYCEYNCTLCGEVCPTKAIPELRSAQKKKEKLGLAIIDESICFPHSQNKQCIVCEEHCPISDKAIKLKNKITAEGEMIMLPYVDKDLCVGCGICQNKCPARPGRAIKVKGKL
ncbi:MAG: 4Fe-4S binding protein [Candidatus Omnitrophica bacterium]|nr:4Fe-4S binding protein [Candidatus Omnitrophota bacterium]MBU1996980.1 4Fe-4S binding protein [Candidatus Omnitrophota bacterium]MBU4333132.1 4Fe-4S binding protein [Candidatus Omnitrophota bacterium]